MFVVTELTDLLKYWLASGLTGLARQSHEFLIGN